jgi:hypothetical protein
MTITFHHPPVPNSTNPLVDFQPADINHYPGNDEKGIYIYGIRAKVDGGLKFIPIVVGEGGDLRKRLYNDHYLGKFATPLARLFGDLSRASGDAKEIWDFSKYEFTLSEIIDIFDDALKYDTKPAKGITKVAHVACLKNLIFFQDAAFFHQKTKIVKLPWITNLRIEEAIYYLMTLSSQKEPDKFNDISNIITRITSTLINFKSNFYYVYTSNKDENNSEEVNNILTNVPTRKGVEFIIKDKLRLIHIYTTADAKNSGALTKINIDLSKVQDELVNVGNHGYNDPVTRNFKNPLTF